MIRQCVQNVLNVRDRTSKCIYDDEFWQRTNKKSCRPKALFEYNNCEVCKANKCRQYNSKTNDNCLLSDAAMLSVCDLYFAYKYVCAMIKVVWYKNDTIQRAAIKVKVVEAHGLWQTFHVYAYIYVSV